MKAAGSPRPSRVASATAEPKARGRSEEDLLVTLFASLDRFHVRYCVLHSWEDLPRAPEGDLDIAVHPDDRARLAEAIAGLRKIGFLTLQCLAYAPGAFYFVFGRYTGEKLRTASLDVAFEHWRSGMCVPDVRHVVTHRKRLRGFWTSAPEAEFAYLLTKRAWKQTASAKDIERLGYLAVSIGVDYARQLAVEIFGRKRGNRIVESVLKGDLSDSLRGLRRRQWLRNAVGHPFKLARLLARDANRRLRRFTAPTGLLIAVLGTDGTGKSTLIHEMESRFAPVFRRVKHVHWTPRLILPTRKPAPNEWDPHSRKARGSLASCCLLSAIFIDYWLSYIFVLGPFRVRTGLILWDRYLNDVLVDPLRYRYGGPAWFARILVRLAPSPDLVFLLDAETDLILTRKPELQRSEIVRQKYGYAQLRFPRSELRTLSTNGTVGATFSEVSDAILMQLNRRFQSTQPEWLRASPCQN